VIFLIDAVIFDMDGVIVDTEGLYREACKEVVRRYGGIITEELFIRQMGLRMKEAQKIVVELAKLPLAPEDFGKEYMEEFLKRAKSKLKPNDGLLELLDFLYSKVKLGVASSTVSNVVYDILRTIDVLNYFDYVIGGDMVENAKPAPDIYLKCAEHLKVEPENCIAIEDSPVGIKSAKTSGMIVYAIRHKENQGLDLSQADKVFDGLRQLKGFMVEKLQSS